MTTGRVLVNMPASQGAIGDVYNFRVAPSLTLGCGSWGGNSVSENIGGQAPDEYQNHGCKAGEYALVSCAQQDLFQAGRHGTGPHEYSDRRRACIITDKTMEQLGHVRKVEEVLERMGIEVRVFPAFCQTQILRRCARLLDMVNAFQPDMFIALGGGSPMDAAKIIWLLYEKAGYAL